MLLGSTRSIGPSARLGGTTPTDTTPASGAVDAETSSALWRRRGTTPMTSRPASRTRPIRKLHAVLDSGIAGLPGCWLVVEKVFARRTPAEDAVDERDEEQRGEGCH